MELEVRGRPSIQITIQPCGEAAEVWSKHSSFYTWLLRLWGRLQRFPPALAFEAATHSKADEKSSTRLSRGDDPRGSLSRGKCLISCLFPPCWRSSQREREEQKPQHGSTIL